MSQQSGFMNDIYASVKPAEDTTVSKKVIVAHQWNWGEFFRDVMVSLKRNIFLCVPIFAAFLVGSWMQSPVTQQSQASSASATVSFLPEFDTLPKEKTFQLWIRSEKQVATVYLEILFDPKAIRMSKEITTVDQRFITSSVSHTTEANATGKIIMSYKNNPAHAVPVTSSFRFADISFVPVAKLQGQTTPVTFGDESKIQAVDGSWLLVKRFGSTYMLVDEAALQTNSDSLQQNNQKN